MPLRCLDMLLQHVAAAADQLATSSLTSLSMCPKPQAKDGVTGSEAHGDQVGCESNAKTVAM